jgi:hypothetical protein
MVGLLAGCTGGHPHPGSHGNTASPGAPSSAPTLTPARAQGLTKDLAAGTQSGLRDALQIPAGQTVAPSAAQQVAALSPVNFDVDSFRAVDTAHAVVHGHVGNPQAGQPTAWLFNLVYTGGQWKIADARPDR